MVLNKKLTLKMALACRKLLPGGKFLPSRKVFLSRLLLPTEN